ncbi:hypothetical protein G159_15090 [Planococcus glaciei CHR43]|nr:hypothetical protein G159_15090 [Planococcus glaciei CHR43]
MCFLINQKNATASAAARVFSWKKLKGAAFVRFRHPATGSTQKFL